MEALGVAIFVIIVGGFLTGMVLFTMDDQAQWHKRKSKKKD